MDKSLYEQKFNALLFDMDGTLLNSTAVIERIWGQWAGKYGLDVPSFLSTVHGKQAVTTITELKLPGVDPIAEAADITAAEVTDIEGVCEVGGAQAFLAKLDPTRWAVVTSAPIELAKRRMQAAGIPLPSVLISAEDVETGKPSPEGFLLAARRLGVAPNTCLAIEDSQAGIASAEAAGCTVLVINETHKDKQDSEHTAVVNFTMLQPIADDKGYITITRCT